MYRVFANPRTHHPLLFTFHVLSLEFRFITPKELEVLQSKWVTIGNPRMYQPAHWEDKAWRIESWISVQFFCTEHWSLFCWARLETASDKGDGGDVAAACDAGGQCDEVRAGKAWEIPSGPLRWCAHTECWTSIPPEPPGQEQSPLDGHNCPPPRVHMQYPPESQVRIFTWNIEVSGYQLDGLQHIYYLLHLVYRYIAHIQQ